MNKFWHSVVDKRAKEQKGAWGDFLDGGKQAIASMK
jgi:hypothetical protein